MATQQYDLKDFSRVEVEGAFRVDIVRADGYSVSVDAGDPGHVRVDRSGDTLRIGRRGWLGFLAGERPRATVTMPLLEGIELSGASHGKISGFKSDREMAVKLSGASHLELREISCGKLRMDLSGASNLVGEAAAQETAMSVSGASRVELSGSGGKGSLRLSGASQARLSAFSLTDTGVECSGASSSQLKVEGKLDINLSGASRLEYAGSPTLGDVRVSGASTLNRR